MAYSLSVAVLDVLHRGPFTQMVEVYYCQRVNNLLKIASFSGESS